jgi:hypothetical protein
VPAVTHMLCQLRVVEKVTALHVLKYAAFVDKDG